MELEAFNRHCIAAKLPPLGAAQWELLGTTLQGRLIQLQIDAEAPEFAPALELVVRSVSPLAQTALENLGYLYSAQTVLDLAEREQMRLFSALHKSRTDLQAKRYLAGLGFAKPEKPVTPPPYYSFHVYGNKGAICFSEAQTRQHLRPTINVEGALIMGGSKTEFDWRNKLIVQLTPEEMFLVLAVMNGKLNQVQFAGHGVSHDKMLEIHLQQSHYFVRLVQKGRSPVSVPMQAQHALNLTSLLYQQIKKNHPHLSMDEMRAMEDQLVRMHGAAVAS